jgi:hypothetical protein
MDETNIMKQLQELYEASESSDWNGCLEALRKLLPLLSKQDALSILFVYINQFITGYSNDKTLDIWQVQLNCTQIGSTNQNLKDLHLALEIYTIEPGVSNFRNAIKKLINLIEVKVWGQTENEVLLETFAGVLMGILLADWGRENHDSWNRWYQRESRSDMFILATDFWPSLKTKQMIRRLWQSVAKNIEDALP